MDTQTTATTVSEAPTSEQLRRALVDRARAYATLKDCTLRNVGDASVGDHRFFIDVESGKNFTVDRYQKAMDWLDAHWPALGSPIHPAGEEGR